MAVRTHESAWAISGADGPLPRRVQRHRRELRVLGTKERRTTKGTNVRAVQLDGTMSCDASETLGSVFCQSGGASDGARCATSPAVGLCLKKP